MKETVRLYDGQLRAKVLCKFVCLGEGFTLIKPGYDAQGRRRKSWTQVVWKGVPVWEHKLNCDPSVALEKFETAFDKQIGRKHKLLKKALEMTHAKRTKSFKDGSSGEAPAPTLAWDGRDDGLSYPT